MAQLLNQIRAKLPAENTPQDQAKRNQYWGLFDVNNNGYLSLAQVDKGMRDVIQLPELFALKPVLIRAFTAAKNKLKAKNAHGDDYVSKAQFKFLVIYLNQYYEYWIAFDEIDTSNDRRVTPQEFKVAAPILQKWGINASDPAKIFKEIDTNNGGFILFDEFCKWAVQKGLDVCPSTLD